MKIIYETENCSRCGGSGHYSYNQINGTTCFRCNGRKETRTKRGQAAYDFATAMLEAPASEIVAGDRVRATTATGWVRGEVLAVDHQAQSGARWKNSATGEWEPIPQVALTFQIKGEERKLKFSPSWTVRRTPTEEQCQKIMDYQENLTKAGKPRKRKIA